MEDQQKESDSPQVDLSQDLPLPGLTGDEPTVVQPPQRARITVVDVAYHQHVDMPPTTLLGDSVRFSRELKSDEQPYERRMLATEEWRPLDCGWIDKAGMLLLRNDEGWFPVRPTPEQVAEVSERIIELTFDLCLNPSDSPLIPYEPRGRSILVPPHESCRFYPADAKRLMVRCRKGRAQYMLVLVSE